MNEPFPREIPADLQRRISKKVETLHPQEKELIQGALEHTTPAVKKVVNCNDTAALAFEAGCIAAYKYVQTLEEENIANELQSFVQACHKRWKDEDPEEG